MSEDTIEEGHNVDDDFDFDGAILPQRVVEETCSKQDAINIVMQYWGREPALMKLIADRIRNL